MRKKYCKCGCNKILISKNPKTCYVRGHNMTGRRRSKQHRINNSLSSSKGLKLRSLKIQQEILSKILKNKKECYLNHHLQTDRGAHYFIRNLWELYYKKKWPKNKHACHTCDNEFCINIFHIFTGTNADNMKDRNKKGRQARGENNGSAKLTEKDVITIRKKYISENHNYSELAKMFNVSSKNIAAIVNRITWKHI